MKKIPADRFIQYFLMLVVIWTLIIGGLFFWQVDQRKQFTLELATNQARAHFNKDVAFRLWATTRKLIYVPVSENNPPDPYLAHIPERDIETPSGTRLTLMNPARIVRQLDEEFGHLYTGAGHITGFNVLRPGNAPDEWEARALEAFKAGEKEVFEFTTIDGEPYLRLMQPLRVKAGCLLCHSPQGYEVGEIGGGVGVAVPMKDLLRQENKAFRKTFISYGSIWLLGLVGIGIGFRWLSAGEKVRRRAEDDLLLSEVRKSAILEAALDCIITMDHRGRIVDFNPAAEHTFGFKADQVIGRELSKMLIPEHLRVAHDEGLGRYLGSGDATMLNNRVEMMAMRSDGSEFPVEIAITRIEIEGQPLFTAHLRDITRARKMAERLSYQASHDSLTGLPNRREFERRLARLLEDDQYREGVHSLFYIDLDQFKVVNDTCGHAAGDELLQQIGGLLHSNMRAGDTLARLGGDEFGVLLEYCSLEKAGQVGQELLEAIQKFQFAWKDRRFTVGASIGVVPIIGGGQTLAEVLSAADTACYAAKDHGRNRLHVFRSDDVELVRRQGEMHWIGRIHAAFEEQRFLLYRQALVSLQEETGRNQERYEILIMMRDEKGDLLPPGTFLPAAEHYNLMPSIDRWVVRTYFEWLASHPEEMDRLAMCCINLSGHSVTDETFCEYIAEQLGRHGIPPRKICFEITETAAVANLSRAFRFVEILRRKGCRFALDDFGSGMSSFAYLKNLPVDFLKIDGVFVRDIVEDEIDFAMVRSINDIGHVMGKATIAEFVENNAILEKLREIGVDYVQGYGIATPQPLQWGDQLTAFNP